MTGFDGIAKWTARATGHPLSFGMAAGVIVVWLVSGPFFHWSDTWQLVINTGTTIITFLMVFLIQSTQNRDTGAIQIKLDELIRSVEGAHNALMDLEELDEEEIARVRKAYTKLAADAREELKRGMTDTSRPDAVFDAPKMRSKKAAQ